MKQKKNDVYLLACFSPNLFTKQKQNKTKTVPIDKSCPKWLSTGYL